MAGVSLLSTLFLSFIGPQKKHYSKAQAGGMKILKSLYVYVDLIVWIQMHTEIGPVSRHGEH